jgi:hypothetical protein
MTFGARFRGAFWLVPALGFLAMVSTCGASAGSSDAGGEGAANCHGGLACSGTSSCAFDCEGNTGNQAGLGGFARIACNCSNGSLVCNIMYESNGGGSQNACPADLSASCSSCNLCQVGSGAGARLCFCTKEGQWVCT